MMRKFRILVLGTASLLALEIGGAASAEAGEVLHSVSVVSATPACQPSAASNELREDDRGWAQQQMRKDDIRWAQTELRTRGLYKGSLDGILGSETKRALQQFQRTNGLTQTASLDAQTWDALTGDGGGVGSSMSTESEHNGSLTDPRASTLGR
jgi:peptidoglycan hydrolase-like protein with peptidoglycan-binding domain